MEILTSLIILFLILALILFLGKTVCRKAGEEEQNDSSCSTGGEDAADRTSSETER